MGTSSSFLLSFVFILLLILFSRATSARVDDFLECLSDAGISNVTLTPSNPSYTSILEDPLLNLRFLTNCTPKPQVIVTPVNESQIQATIICAKEYGMQIRARSGAQDFEGLSSAAHYDVAFVVIDLAYLNSVSIDEENKTAWVGAGATNGELYYQIAKTSGTLGFPSGVCPTVGVGGLVSGGGYGMMVRKYGLAIDNAIDAHIIDVNGTIHDRESMGEDLFWAITGGGAGGSFGVVTAWKLKLVEVPPNVTVFTVNRTLEQNATNIVYRWQSVSHEINEDVFIRLIIRAVNSPENSTERTIQAQFTGFFLGGVDELLPLIEAEFPELGLVEEDCSEMSWVESLIYVGRIPYFLEIPSNATLDFLLQRTPLSRGYVKAKSDYAVEPISETGLEGLWELFYEPEATIAEILFTPFGGRMSEISPSETPFPHRDKIYQIQYLVIWQYQNQTESCIDWIRRLYKYMAPYVSKCPRGAYINYRDLDLGTNSVDDTSVKQASVWGLKYFKYNFYRLVAVKSIVDPGNFFWNEQSIPPLSVCGKKKGVQISGKKEYPSVTNLLGFPSKYNKGYPESYVDA